MTASTRDEPTSVDPATARAPDSPNLMELCKRTAQLELEARKLSDSLRLLLDGNEVGDASQVIDAEDIDPIYESRRAAIFRAFGMEREALHHAIRASDALRSAGCESEARDILVQSAANLERLDADSLELLSFAWERISMKSLAASASLAAAEEHRIAGRLDRSLAMCQRTSGLRSNTNDLQRCWGLTLLANAEPAGAMGHLQNWVNETGGEPVPLIWHAQALFEVGATQAMQVAVEQLTHTLDVSHERPRSALCEQITRQLRDAGTHATCLRDRPFWKSDGFTGRIATPHEISDAEAVTSAGEEPNTSPDAVFIDKRTERALNPRVFVANNVWFQRAKLSDILADEDVEVQYCPHLDGVMERLSREVLPVDLILFPFSSAVETDLEMIAKIRELPRLQEVPILGVTTIDRAGLDFARLRLLGVVGLIDRNALPEHVAFRINSVIRKEDPSGRRFDRAPAFFAVDLEAEGSVSCEYSTNLSCGGLRIASSRPLPKGTVVTVRFRLPLAAGSLIEAHGHVVWTGTTKRSDIPQHLIGVFFEPLQAEAQRHVSREVQAILALSHW